jgi:hypothetical protein
MSVPSLSLMDIETDLHELFTHWQEAESPEEIAAAESSLMACAEAQCRKVDGVRKYWRFCDQMEAAAKAEAEAQRKRAQMWGARRDRLKAMVQYVMETFHVKRFEGNQGSLSLRGNGGRQPVEVSNPDLIPDEFIRVTVEMSGEVWEEIMKYFGPTWVKEKMGRVVTKAPALSLIGEALERGPVAGARLSERGSHVECR